MIRLLTLLLGLLLATPSASLALAEDASEGDESDDDGDDEPPWVKEADEEDDKGDKGDEGGESDDDGDDGSDAAPTGASEPTASSEPSTVVTADSTISDLKGGGAVGLGVAVGTINGLSLKVWPKKAHGLVIHLGTAVPVLNSLATSLSYRAHLPAILVPNSPVAIHVNLGPAFRGRFVFFTDGTYSEIGGGLAIGTGVTVAKVPAEFFFEVIPTFGGGVGPANVGIGFSVDGLVGARFYL